MKSCADVTATKFLRTHEQRTGKFARAGSHARPQRFEERSAEVGFESYHRPLHRCSLPWLPLLLNDRLRWRRIRYHHAAAEQSAFVRRLSVFLIQPGLRKRERGQQQSADDFHVQYRRREPDG